jgi:serine/threonine-protein kinase HipA
VKLPSPSFSGVPENEYVMMTLAKQVGIDVPEIRLIPLDTIKGLPQDLGRLGNHAFVIKRFDRSEDGPIHIEDFAQVFGVYPEKKYGTASYRNIAEVIWNAMGREDLEEFIRRFVFNALIGNGDMHLKNWSVIYHDQVTPSLAPAYDYVSTLPYIPDDNLALSFAHSKAFSALTMESFQTFARKSNFPEHLILSTVEKTVSRFKKAWEAVGSLPIHENVYQIITNHLKTLPLF